MRRGRSSCLFFDSDLKSVKPWWVERLTTPIINGYSDFVTPPFYIRHKYDGTITNQVCYPLITSLFCLAIRQPIGGDFGVGKELIDIYLTKAKKLFSNRCSKIWYRYLVNHECNSAFK